MTQSLYLAHENYPAARTQLRSATHTPLIRDHFQTTLGHMHQVFTSTAFAGSYPVLSRGGERIKQKGNIATAAR